MKCKVFGGTWIQHERSSSSGNNVNLLMEWLNPGHEKGEVYSQHDYEIYVDNLIREGIDSNFPNKVGWLLESRPIISDLISFCVKNKYKLAQKYKYIFTCQDDLVEMGPPFAYTVGNAGPWVLPNNRRIYEKKKLVSMIASSKNLVPGHARRLVWADTLKNVVDLYGNGRPHQLIHKEGGLIDYMFSVAIENDCSDSYFSEKLTDCFVTGTIPIYYGSKKAIQRYFDENGVIYLESKEQVEKLTSQDYYDRIESVKRNFETAVNFISAEDYFAKNYL